LAQVGWAMAGVLPFVQVDDVELALRDAFAQVLQAGIYFICQVTNLSETDSQSQVLFVGDAALYLSEPDGPTHVSRCVPVGDIESLLVDSNYSDNVWLGIQVPAQYNILLHLETRQAERFASVLRELRGAGHPLQVSQVQDLGSVINLTKPPNFQVPMIPIGQGRASSPPTPQPPKMPSSAYEESTPTAEVENLKTQIVALKSREQALEGAVREARADAEKQRELMRQYEDEAKECRDLLNQQCIESDRLERERRQICESLSLGSGGDEPKNLLMALHRLRDHNWRLTREVGELRRAGESRTLPREAADADRAPRAAATTVAGATAG